MPSRAAPTPRVPPELPLLIVLNPAAGRGAAARAWIRARAALDRSGAEYSLRCTSGPGDAQRIAAAARPDEWRGIVAVGGDGTVHELVNGLLRAGAGRADLPLGIVPAGSGNDFAKLVGVPVEPGAAVRHLLGSSVRRVDAGRVGAGYFSNGVGIGLDARVAVEAGRVRRLRGLAIYLLALTRVLRGFSPPRMRVFLDGALFADRPLTLVTTGNGGCHGGGFWICPDAEIDDGALDVCIAEALGITGILDLLPRVMRGAHVGRPGVTLRRVRRVRVESDDPLTVHADGEILDEQAREVDIEVLPAALAVLA